MEFKNKIEEKVDKNKLVYIDKIAINQVVNRDYEYIKR